MGREAAAIEAVADRIDGDDAGDADQHSLFDAPESPEGRALDRRRGAGRPVGSRNKRTERTVRWLLSHHRDPREALLAVTDMHPADLAAVLGCSLFEAQQEIRLCAQAVLPYVAQKMPIAVDLTSRQAVYLTISNGEVRHAQPSDPWSLAARVVESVEYQELNPGAPERVGQSELDSEPNAEQQQGDS